jgi:DNA-binding IclR family transcriptional regulator
MSAARDPGSMRTAAAVLRVLGDQRDQRTNNSIAKQTGLHADLTAGALRSLRGQGLVDSADPMERGDYLLWWATPLGVYCRELLEAAPP